MSALVAFGCLQFSCAEKTMGYLIYLNYFADRTVICVFCCFFLRVKIPQRSKSSNKSTTNFKKQNLLFSTTSPLDKFWGWILNILVLDKALFWPPSPRKTQTSRCWNYLDPDSSQTMKKSVCYGEKKIDWCRSSNNRY